MNKDLSGFSNDFDVIVIGGGIVGATAFRELCMSDLNVLLIEKDDFCRDISSGSTEMAHGGFRYLLTLKDWPLVIESLVEREILHKSASHLVRRLNFYMPLYHGDEMYFNPSFTAINLPDFRWKIGKYSGYGMSMVGMGMKMYKNFAAFGIKKEKLDTDPAEVEYRKMKPGELMELGFNMNPDGLAGCYKYTDSKIEDVERLVIENILSGLEYAREKNLACSASNRMEMVKFDGGALLVRDHARQKEFRIKAKAVVNATGAHINGINAMVDNSAGDDVHLVAGSHLIVPREMWRNYDLNAAIAWWTNKKIMFAISKGTDRLLIGTHERYVSGEEIKNRNLNYKSDIKGIVEKTKKVFPQFDFDVEKGTYYTRVRPLKPDEKHVRGAANPTRFSRRDYIREIGNMLSVTGKLGPSRCLAEQVAGRVFKILGKTPPQSKTRETLLYGGNIDVPLNDYMEHAAANRPEIDKRILTNVIRRYGSRYPAVLDGFSNSDYEKINPDRSDSLPLCALLYSFNVEGARNMTHAFRRTGTYRHLGEGLNCISNAANYVGEKLGWDKTKISGEIEDYRKYVEKIKKTVE